MARDYQTTADRCRAALKAAGYTTRQVTVRDRGNHMYTSLHVTIRDASVRASAIAEIASSFRDVRRDSMTDEILSGGNTFVDVEYTDAIVDARTTPIERRIAEGVGRDVIAIPGVIVTWDAPRSGQPHDAEVYVRGIPGVYRCWGVRGAARQIAIAALDRGPAPTNWIAALDLDEPTTDEPACAHGAALSVSCIACHTAATDDGAN